MSMRLYVIATFAIGVFGIVVARADNVQSMNDTRQLAKAIDILSRENIILGKEVSGFEASHPTEQGWAVSTILKKANDPAEVFAKLAATGSYPALLAIYVLAPSQFERIAHEFKGAGKVTVVSGDSIEEMSSDEFVGEFLPNRGKATFKRLQFDKIPDLVDTVRGEPRR